MTASRKANTSAFWKVMVVATLQDTQGPLLLWPQTAPELPPKVALPSGTRLRPNPGTALAHGAPPVLPARPAGCSLQTPSERSYCGHLPVPPSSCIQPWLGSDAESSGPGTFLCLSPGPGPAAPTTRGRPPLPPPLCVQPHGSLRSTKGSACLFLLSVMALPLHKCHEG